MFSNYEKVRVMKNKLFGCLAATVLGAAVVLPTSAIAFRGGGGFGGGGMHGGFAGGGFRGGMVTGRSAFVPGVGGFRGGIVTGRSAFVPGGGGLRGSMVTGRSPFVPRVGRFAHAPFASRHVNRFNRPFFFDRFHRRVFFNNSVLFGGYGDWPYYYDYAGYGDLCRRNIWTPYGWQWVNVCYDFGNYSYYGY
jgi:hypothetical protein